MATYDLEEQEQISELKTWWRQYGNLVTSLVTAVALAVIAYQAWNWYQRGQAAQASAILAAVKKAADAGDTKGVRERAGELVERFSGSSQAALAALISAKTQFEAGDVKSAQAQLAWAAENAREAEFRDLARLRLAALLLEQQAYDDALKQLDREPVPAFAARFAEFRGDIHMAQGRKAEAINAYKAGLAKLADMPAAGRGRSDHEAQRQLLRTKLEALGETP